MRICAGAYGGCAAAVQAEEDAGDDVREKRVDDEERFGEGPGLVVGAGEEEVGRGSGGGAGEEGKD